MPTKVLLYPDDWAQISYAIREANQWTCQQCDRLCRRPGELYLGWEYTLTVAHWERDYTSSEIFATCLCLPCHFLHDAPYAWHSRRRHQRIRRWLAGQLEFFNSL